MAASLSFRNQRDASRPPRYRTPSPPRHAVEPLSPHTSPSYRRAPNTSVDTSYQVAPSLKETLAFVGGDEHRGGPGDYAHPPVANTGSTGKPGGHSRSGSTIDTLATVALATSPTFASFAHENVNETQPPPPPLPPHTKRPAMLSDGDESVERPAKRARSERARSPSWSRIGERPATSHISTTFDSMKTDAELLLNLARPSNRSAWTHQPRTIDEHSELRDAGSGWSANTMRVRNNSQYAVEEVPSSVFSHNGAVPPARMRSRSDGSAMFAKPVINSFMEGSYNNNQSPYSGGAVKDGLDADGPEPVSVTFDPAAETRANPKMGPPPSASETQTQTQTALPDSSVDGEMDVDSSTQAQCAACTLVRAPANGGDDSEVTWVNCDGCDRWFHIVCAGFKDDREIRTVDKFICRECRPTHGPTTFVRKSTRTRTAIDYAGLNQGFVKSSAEAPEHHYIRPIKEGKISFLPDKFARLPPELVSAQYFQRGVGMTEPVVVPAHLNSRHTTVGRPGFVDDDVPLNEEVSQEEFDEIIDYLTAREDTLEEVVDCGQDLLDMVIPESLTVRNATELYGPDEPVEVIDVKSQQGEDKKWNMQKWADYYYEPDTSKPIRNVISLEMSQSPLGRLIRRPKIVRDLDLQDSVWPADLQAVGDFPKVQFYCLMSVADCYTDFHVDFGGSSVFYHILKGKKTFFFIPPKDKHLKKYEEWCNSSSQDTTFLGDLTKECYRVDLCEGDTMLIPSGWIHAVWTPENSLVIGGNFLTRMNYAMQIKVAKIEKDTKVPMKFRYPFFQKIMWYTALRYLAEDPVPQNVLDSFARDENYRFYREYPIYHEFGDRANTAEPGSDYYNARFHSQAELEGLPDLARYLFRTALIAGGYPVDGVAKEAKNAVNRSIPKGQGDPIDTAKKFGVWSAWKRGNELAAEWTRPGSVSLDTKADISDKKANSRPSRRSERNAKLTKTVQQPALQGPDQQAPALNQMSGDGSIPSASSPSVPAKRKAPSVDLKNGNEEDHQVMSKGNGLGPKRMACEACRKRRIRCRHKDGIEPVLLTATKQKRTTDDDLEGYMRSDIPIGTAASENANGSVTASQAGTLALAAESMHTDKLSGQVASGSELGALYPPKKPRSKACDECRKSKVSISPFFFNPLAMDTVDLT